MSDPPSTSRARYYIILANDLGYLDRPNIEVQFEEIGKLLHTYSRAKRARPDRSPP